MNLNPFLYTISPVLVIIYVINQHTGPFYDIGILTKECQLIVDDEKGCGAQ